jgi:hypothetical protein
MIGKRPVAMILMRNSRARLRSLSAASHCSCTLMRRSLRSGAEAPAYADRFRPLRRPEVRRRQRHHALLRYVRRPVGRAARPDHGAGNPDDRVGRGLLPRCSPLADATSSVSTIATSGVDEIYRAEAAEHADILITQASRAPSCASLHAARHGERHDRPARRARHRFGPRRRHLDGRRDRAGARDCVSRTAAHAYLDHVLDGRSQATAADVGGARASCSRDRRATAKLFAPVREDVEDADGQAVSRSTPNGRAAKGERAYERGSTPPAPRARCSRSSPRATAARRCAAHRADARHPRHERSARSLRRRARSRRRDSRREAAAIEGMGHTLPRAAWPRIVDAIAAHTTEPPLSSCRTGAGTGC